MKTLVIVMACVLMFAASGCAQKSASEQLKSDMDKAGKQLNKDMKNLAD